MRTEDLSAPTYDEIEKAGCERHGFETYILHMKYYSMICEPVGRPFLQLLVAASAGFRVFEQCVLSFSTKRFRLHLGKVNSPVSLYVSLLA
jgi:hypothetical protein